MPHLKIYEQTHCYEMHGTGDPLVLITGMGTSRLFWWKQLDPLSEKFSIVTLDDRVIDNSSRADSLFAIDDMADDIEATLNPIPRIVSINFERGL